MVVVDEAFFGSPEIIVAVILPLLQEKNVVVLCLSSLNVNNTIMMEMVYKRLDDGSLALDVVELEEMCAKCIEAEKSECPHIVVWSNPVKSQHNMDFIRKITPRSLIHIVNQEMFSTMAMGGPVFNALSINSFINGDPMDFVGQAPSPFYVSCDPAMPGGPSYYSLVVSAVVQIAVNGATKLMVRCLV